jgi:N-acyl-D-aspartate/D-glutamate deacylase
MLDLKIVNGTLIDGTGEPGVRGDVGIKDGRIAYVGKPLGKVDAEARETIDATGLTVTPGFVDLHTHYDAQAFWDPSLSPSSHFGVTTIYGGNCGFSIAPLSGKKADGVYLMRMLSRVEGMPLESLEAGVPWDWKTFGEYLERVEGRLAINHGFMVGHSALRRTVMGERAVGHQATEAEIAAMQKLMRESLAAGGMGFSSTINNSHNDADGNPVPSRHATHEEILALASVVSEFEGTTVEFLPKIGDAFPPEQLELLTNLSKSANRPVNWNILIPDAKRAEIFRSQLGASDYAAARGGRVVPLVQAHVGSTFVNFNSGFVLDMYKDWDALFRKPVDERVQALKDPAYRRQLDESARTRSGARSSTTSWGDWIFAGIFEPANKRFEGKRVGDVAKELDKEPFDAMLDIVVEDRLRTSFRMPQRGSDEESWRMRGAAWLDERTIVGASDAGAHLDLNDTFATPMSVISEGVRKRKLLTLEQAVRQLSSVPARLVGLRERGELREGWHADICVFDAQNAGVGPLHMRYDLPAKAGRLYAESVGVKHVFVNGREIMRDGQFRGIYPGRTLRSGRDTYTVTP